LTCAPGGACQSHVPLAFLLPLFISNHDFRSTAVIVNGGSAPTYVDATLRDASGAVIIQRRFNMVAYNNVQIDISDLLASAHSDATTGNLQVAPAADGSGIGVIGQMSIAYIGSLVPSYLEYEPSKPSPSNSLVLRAVGDGGQGSPIVGITSVAASAQNVTIECFGASGPAFSKSVAVPPMGTLVTPACNNAGGDPLAAVSGGAADSQAPGPNPQARGISLTTDGPPGSFAAVGLAPYQGADGTSFTPVLFSDPKGEKTSTTVFAGLPVGGATLLPGGDYIPQLSVANFSSSPANVTVKYSRSTGDTPEVKTVATLVVPASGTAIAELSGLQGDPDLQNSFEVVSDQPPGDVVDKISSQSETGIRRVELPGKDLENSHNSGNHPWTVADGTDSTILLFNETAAEENFTVQVASGQTVWTKRYTIAPLATKAIGINRLIADQVKDDKGNVLPMSLEGGEASWFEAQQFGGTGRLLQSNPSQFAARSFSCGYYGVVSGGTWYPDVTSEMVGQTNDLGELDAEISLTEDVYSCTGTDEGPSNEYYYGWDSEDTSIATISGDNTFSNVNVEGVSAGNATIFGRVYDQYGCEYGQYVTETVTGDQTPVIAEISPDVWPAGSTTTVTFTGQNFGGNAPTLSFSPGNGIGYTLSSYNDNHIVANITVAASTPDEDPVNVTVTNNGYGGNNFNPVQGSGGESATSNGATATVQAPAQAAIYRNTKTTYTNQTFTSCDGTTTVNNSYGYERCVFYQIEDASGNPVYATFNVDESVTVVVQNITPSTSTGGTQTNSTGDFGDDLHLISASPLPANACSVRKQTFTVSGSSQPIRVNCLQFSQTDVSITDVTANPGECSSANYSCP
jgi:hypothetical protein